MDIIAHDTLGVPIKYIKETPHKDRIVCLAHKTWIGSLVKNGELRPFRYHDQYSEDEVEAFLKLGEDFGPHWQHISIRVLSLHPSKKVIPLPRARPQPATSSSQNLSYSQLLHYVAHTNYKNMWKDAYKKFMYSSEGREIPNISLANWDTVLLDIVCRTYGCPIIYLGSHQGTTTLRNIEPHANCLPTMCAVFSSTSQTLLLLQPYVAYSAHDCVSFSPAVLTSSRSRPLFIIFQLLQLMRDSHDRGLVLGDLNLHDLLLTEGLWLQVIPKLEDNLHCPANYREKRSSTSKPTKSDAARISHLEARGLVTRCMEEGHSTSEVNQAALSQLLDLWVRGRLSNLDYLTALNCLAGRRFGHPNHHHVLPWVTDFSSPNGGWRDLTRSKFRINKGDRQLDLTFDSVLTQQPSTETAEIIPPQVPHHVSDVLSEITYYVYLARRTPRSLLCKYVRPKWVPAEYPSSIQRMQEWTPDECIPEFYTEPTTFKSIHEDLPNLEIPSWASSPEQFVEKHRQALESVYVSERLHHWIDLTFGYKLSGSAAIKSKNVCLYLVDQHTHLTDSGVVQLFSQPHPHRLIPSPYTVKVAPKLIHIPQPTNTKRRGERSMSSVTSPSGVTPVAERNEGEDQAEVACEEEPRPLGLTKLLSKSRSSLLYDDAVPPKTIYLPKDYNPVAALQDIENFYNFTNQALYEPPHIPSSKSSSASDTIAYRQAVASRRIREMQILGCIVVELYLANKLRALFPISGLDSTSTFEERMKKCLTVLDREWHELPSSVKQAVSLTLQLDEHGKKCQVEENQQDLFNIKYPTVTKSGLPPPSAHQLLQPLIKAGFPFPIYFEKLYSLLLSVYKLDQMEENNADKKIEIFSKELPSLLPLMDSDGLDLLLPSIRDLLNSSAATSAAWQLFDPIAKELGPRATCANLLGPISDLFEHGGASKAKLYHRSFLLKLIVRLGLKNFISNFATALVEAVGGYRDQHNKSPTEQGPSSHKTAPLKSASIGNLSAEADATGILSPLDDDSSGDSERLPTAQHVNEKVGKQNDGDETDAEVEPEVFVFESNEEEEEGPILSPPAVALDLVEHLGLDQFDQEVEGTSPQAGPSEENTIAGAILQSNTEVSPDKPASTSLCHQQEWRSPRKPISECPVSEMSADSILWLAHRLGPVLTAKNLSRNLLRMLSLCYLGEESLSPAQRQENSIPSLRLIGDENAARVIECLSSIAALYGEQLVISQYFPHISELIALCKRKLTVNLEGGLIGCLALLRHIIPYLSDATLMEHISDILKSILHPSVRLVATTRAPFPSGITARTALAYKLLEALYVIALRIGTDMTRLHLAPTLQRFFLAFDKVYDQHAVHSDSLTDSKSMAKSYDDNGFLEVKRDGSTSEWTIRGSPLQIAHSRIRENDSADSFSPPVPIGNQDVYNETRSKATLELKMVFTEKLAHCAYLPFYRFIGENVFEQFLKNETLIRELCYEYEQQNPRLNQCHHPGHTLYLSDFLPPPQDNERGTSGSFGSNVAVIGNRIELQRPDIPSAKPLCSPTCSSLPPEDITSLISKRMQNTSRHLRGNWLAYWEHEIGRAEKDMRFNFKQIKLQQFTGHSNSVRALLALDNENSFISGSRDKTVKLWSLRSQGDGSAVSSCQWTYSNHRKSVLAIAFLESMRLVASCDSVVHLWDPFMGALVAQLDGSSSARVPVPPVNVLRAMPAPSRTLLAATTESTLRVIDARTCTYVQELKVAPNPAGLIRCVAVAPSGTWVAVGQSSGHLSLLDIRTGMVLNSWKGHEGEVLQLVTVNDSVVVSSSLDQSVAAWGTDLGTLKFHLKGPTEPVHCLSSYGGELISGTTANRIGVHTSVGDQASFSSTRLRSDTFKGVLTAMGVLPLNRLLLLGSDAGHISLLC